MPRRLFIALLLLVAAPLALLGWVSATSMRDQRKVAEQQLQALLTARLSEIDKTLAGVLDSYSRRLGAQLDTPGNVTETLRTLKLSDSIVRQGILVSANGVLVFPRKPVSDYPDDIALYAALAGMIASRPEAIVSEVADAPQQTQQTQRTADPPTNSRRSQGRSSSQPRGDALVADLRGAPLWQVWYMDEGSQLILWFPRRDGSSLGILLERVRWVADLTAALPDTVSTDRGNDSAARTPGFTALTDESQQIVYRWGDEGDCTETPFAAIALSAPLGSWQLEYHADEMLIPNNQSFALYAALAGIGVVLLALGGFVLTSVQRQMRTARNRVSFAGQVSHELRTPLTNIRLYAELAESDLDSLPESESRSKIAGRLSVIDSESKRLGRLVSGVLEMIRDDRKPRGPRIQPFVPDEVIDQTLQQFAPSFENVGLEVHRKAGAGNSVGLDADILETVLVNLLSNVEKYASEGKRVDVCSELSSDKLVVTVSDCGPGIPRRKHRSVFRAFSRLDDSINAPSGTGIGLTIARNAARRHGGELRLASSENGARFELTLPVTP